MFLFKDKFSVQKIPNKSQDYQRRPLGWWSVEPLGFLPTRLEYWGVLQGI